VRFRKGDDAEARALVLRALEEDPSHAGGWRMLGMVLERGKDLDGAEQAYRRALEIDPSAMEALGKLAMLVGRRDPGEAERLLRQAVSTDPTHPESRAVLGGLLESQGRRKEALALYRAGIDAAPNEAIFHGNVARILAGERRFEEARPHAERAVVLLPNRPGPRLQLADLYLRLGRREEAVELATEVGEAAQARGDTEVAGRAARVLDRAKLSGE
jgi:Flp pilus assembly protein TadD